MDTELHRRPRRSGLLGLAGLAALAWAGAAGAQQITTPNGSVTIDYGVLNSVGQSQGTDGYGGQPSYPYGQPASPYGQSAGTYGQPLQLQPSWPYNGQSAYNQVTGAPSAYGQAPYPYPYGQPAYGYRSQGSAQQPLYPPPQYPVSSLLVPAPMGSVPYVPRAAAAPTPAPSMASTAPAETAPAPAEPPA